MMEEKEILFENRYVRDETCLKETYRYLYYKRPKRIALYALIVFEMILTLAMFTVYRKTEYLLFFLLFVFFSVVIVLGYFRGVKASVRRQEELTGGKPLVVNIEIREDGVRVYNDQSDSDFPWSKIKKVRQTENQILLQTQANLMLIISKDGFTKGTFEDFKDFLRAKGYKIK